MADTLTTQALLTKPSHDFAQACTLTQIIWGISNDDVPYRLTVLQVDTRGVFGFKAGDQRVIVDGVSLSFLLGHLDETDDGLRARFDAGERSSVLRLPVLLETRQVFADAFHTIHPVLVGASAEDHYVVWSVPMPGGAAAFVDPTDRSWLGVYAHNGTWQEHAARFARGVRSNRDDGK